MQPWGPFVLRVMTGLILLGHGLPKLLPAWGGPDAAASYLDVVGIQPAFALAIGVGVLQTAGGAGLLAGAYTLVVAPLLLLQTLGAIAIAVWRGGIVFLPATGRGYEFHLLLVAALVCLTLTGPGAWSLDGLRARSAERDALGRARLRSRVG